MDNKDLFQRMQNGYNVEQVEQYISVLKAEYKKVFEYAKATEANNEKLKKICRSLSDENKAMKAGAGSAPADSSVLASVEKIVKLSEEITKENVVLRTKISK